MVLISKAKNREIFFCLFVSCFVLTEQNVAKDQLRKQKNKNNKNRNSIFFWKKKMKSRKHIALCFMDVEQKRAWTLKWFLKPARLSDYFFFKKAKKNIKTDGKGKSFMNVIAQIRFLLFTHKNFSLW